MELSDDEAWREGSPAYRRQTPVAAPSVEALRRIWGPTHVKVFLSHKATVKRDVSSLKSALARYPAYEHIAVIIAEDITSRFLNVLSLMSGSIPMVAIQLDALEVGQHLVLNFIQVLDLTETAGG